MLAVDGADPEVLAREEKAARELAARHAADISGSVCRRMRELGLNALDLARASGLDADAVARLLAGDAALALDTLARVEAALGFRLDGGFRYSAEDGAL